MEELLRELSESICVGSVEKPGRCTRIQERKKILCSVAEIDRELILFSIVLVSFP